MKAIIEVEEYLTESNRLIFESNNRSYIFYKDELEIIDEKKEEAFLTEEQAVRLLKDADLKVIDRRIDLLKEKDWIKKSAKQEFEDYYKSFKEIKKVSYKNLYSEQEFYLLYDKAIQAIKEAEEK